MERNAKVKESQRTAVRMTVKAVLDDRTLSPDQLRDRLEEKGIGVIEHRNAEGYLYGVHYVHAKSGVVFKASEVGKTVTAAQWRKVEGLHRLDKEERQTLSKVLRGYMDARTEQLGNRSSAIRQLNIRELETHVQQHGYKLVDANPLLEAFVRTQQSRYAGQLETDVAALSDLQRGIEQLRSEHRRATATAAGFVQTPGGMTFRHNEDVKLRDFEIGEMQNKETTETKFGPLTAQEVTLLTQVGRQGGLGSIPDHVNSSTIDWSFWKDKFRPSRSLLIEDKLHKNYLRVKTGEAFRTRQPADYLAQHGILMQPTKFGYAVYRHAEPDVRAYTSKEESARVSASGYGQVEFERHRNEMVDPVVQNLFRQISERENMGLRNLSDGSLKKGRAERNKKVPSTSNLRKDLGRALRPGLTSQQRRALYDILGQKIDQADTSGVQKQNKLRISD
jgi:hypothetical protein